MSDGSAQIYALTTKILVECDKITVRINKNAFLRLWCGLRAKVKSRDFAKCSGVVCSTKKCGPMLEVGTYILVESQQNIGDEEKNVCFKL